MLKVFYCSECYRIAYLAKNKASCNKCNLSFQKLDVPYLTFINLTQDERSQVLKERHEENQ